MSGTETTATPETPHAAKGEEKFRWDKFWWWGMIVFVILLLIIATALALAKVNNKTDGVLAAVNDTRGDLVKMIRGVENKTNLLASQTDLSSLTARVAEHEEKDNKIHRAQARTARPVVKDTSGHHADAVQAGPLQANPPAVSELPRPENIEPKSEKVDVTAIVADACGDRGIVRSGRFRDDGSVIWRCADEVRVVQQEAREPQGGMINVSPQPQRYYGARNQPGGYDVPWGGVVIGCIVGTSATAGAALPACAKVAGGALLGDVAGYSAGGVIAGGKYREEMRTVGMIAGGGYVAHRLARSAPALMAGGVGGPVGMAP